jgi:hypothetical protein
LLELLLTEVVPRLTRLACGPGPVLPSDRSAWPGRPVASMSLGGGPPRVGPLLVHALELAEFCQQGESEGAGALIAQLRESGVPIEAIFLQVIQPAAQHLGQGWSDDRLSFTTTTPQYRSDVFNIGGREFYRNKAGRCEDAPCCGCCTI